MKPSLLARSLGVTFSRTLELRQKADYGSEPMTAADAERAATEAEACIEAVERLIRG